MQKGHQKCISTQSFKRYIFWVVWPLRDMDRVHGKADISYNLRSTTTNPALRSSDRCYGATGSAQVAKSGVTNHSKLSILIIEFKLQFHESCH